MQDTERSDNTCCHYSESNTRMRGTRTAHGTRTPLSRSFSRNPLGPRLQRLEAINQREEFNPRVDIL